MVCWMALTTSGISILETMSNVFSGIGLMSSVSRARNKMHDQTLFYRVLSPFITVLSLTSDRLGIIINPVGMRSRLVTAVVALNALVAFAADDPATILARILA